MCKTIAFFKFNIDNPLNVFDNMKEKYSMIYFIYLLLIGFYFVFYLSFVIHLFLLSKESFGGINEQFNIKIVKIYLVIFEII